MALVSGKQCLNCGSPNLCDAHILPAALGRDIIKSSGKNLVLLAPDRKGVSQSGLSDSYILCSSCDGILGKYDKQAIEIIRLAGTSCETINRSSGVFMLKRDRDINHEYLALFGAAVVWRASVSEQVDFALGKNEDWFRDIIFRKSSELPIVTIARLVGANDSIHSAVGQALMYPLRTRSTDGISFARFYACGFMFLVQTSRRKCILWEKGAITELGRSIGAARITGITVPFEKLTDLADARDSKYVREILSKRE